MNCEMGAEVRSKGSGLLGVSFEANKTMSTVPPTMMAVAILSRKESVSPSNLGAITVLKTSVRLARGAMRDCAKNEA